MYTNDILFQAFFFTLFFERIKILHKILHIILVREFDKPVLFQRSVSKNSPDKHTDEKSKSEEIEATILYRHYRDLMDEALLDVRILNSISFQQQ